MKTYYVVRRLATNEIVRDRDMVNAFEGAAGQARANELVEIHNRIYRENKLFVSEEKSNLLSNEPLDDPMRDYKSDVCFVEHRSDIDPSAAEKLVGKTVARVDAEEFGFKLTFVDGVTLELTLRPWGDGMLAVEVADEPPMLCTDNAQFT